MNDEKLVLVVKPAPRVTYVVNVGKPGRDGVGGGEGGVAATVSVGSVVTGTPGSPAAVVNTGSASAAVLSFTIPRGNPGSPGEDGSPGADGHSPVLTWSGDRIAIDGVATGPNLTGPAGEDGSPGADGHSPVLTWSGDRITIDGVATGPNLTGPAGEDGSSGADGHSPVLSWSGDRIAIDGVATGPNLTGPAGENGSPGADGAAGPNSVSASTATSFPAGTILGSDGGAVKAVQVGTGAGKLAAGDDSRFTDSRTPTAHKSSHAAGGSDPLTPADIGAATASQGAKADMIAGTIYALSDYASLQEAVDAVSSAGGGVVMNARGATINIASTFAPNNSVHVDLNGGTLKWTGAGGGVMVENSTAAYGTNFFSLKNGYLDPGANVATVFKLHSIRESEIGGLVLISGNTTLEFMHLYPDSLVDDPTDGTRNVVRNIFGPFSSEGVNVPLVGTVLILDGSNPPFRVTTNNEFRGPWNFFTYSKGIVFKQYCDSNFFNGMFRITLANPTTPGKCVVFNDSSTPSADVDVWGEHFTHLSCETWYPELEGQIAVEINNAGGILIDYLGNDRMAQGTWPVGMVVDNYPDNVSQGYSITYVENVPGANKITKYVKGDVFVKGTGNGLIFPDGSKQTTAANPYSLPTASTNTLGGVKVDGTSVVINNGVLSAPNTGAGSVTSVSSANSDITVVSGSTTPVLTLNSGVGANKIVKLDGNGKLPAVDGSALTNLPVTGLPINNPTATGTSTVAPTLGSNVVVNGTFATDLSGWDGTVNWSWLSGTAKHTPGSNSSMTQSTTLAVPGTVYRVSLVVSGMTAGTVQLNFGGVAFGSFSGNGTWSGYITANSTNGLSIGVDSSGLFDGAIDSVTVQSVTGGVLVAGASSEFTVDGAGNLVARTVAINGGTASPSVTLTASVDGAASPIISGRRSRGTSSAPTATKSGDTLLTIGGYGYGTSAWFGTASAAISLIASEDYSSSAKGSYLTFSTTVTGTTSRTEKMRVHGSGGVSVGTTTDPGAGSLALQSDTPRLWQFDNGAARSASNPEWGIRPAHADGQLHIESSADGAAWTDVVTVSRSAGVAVASAVKAQQFTETPNSTGLVNVSGAVTPACVAESFYGYNLTGATTITLPNTGLPAGVISVTFAVVGAQTLAFAAASGSLAYVGAPPVQPVATKETWYTAVTRNQGAKWSLFNAGVEQ